MFISKTINGIHMKYYHNLSHHNVINKISGHTLRYPTYTQTKIMTCIYFFINSEILYLMIDL